MGYSFLQNFSSLLEVYAAIYVSMFLDEILINIWTPDYKKKISQLISGMNIPAISYFVKKVEDNIDNNAKDIRGHMKRKALFLFVFCLSLLLLAGLEKESVVLPLYGYLLTTILSVFGFLFLVLGRWTFIKYSRVIVCIGVYSVVLVLLYFFDITKTLSNISWFGAINYKIAVGCMLVTLTIPILWQLFLILVYSKLYKGYMQEKISREAYIYGKAYIAYKIKDMAALPKEYEMVARDFVTAQPKEEDTSLNSLNTILVRRLEQLCELPNVLKVVLSYVLFILRGKHNHEAEYIEQNGFDYESMCVADNSNNIPGQNATDESAPIVDNDIKPDIKQE